MFCPQPCALLQCYILLQGTKCDVREADDVKRLVAFAKQNMKHIDIWVSISDLVLSFYMFLVIDFSRIDVWD